MKIEKRSISKIKPYEKNPRKNDGKPVQALIESIKRHKQVKPIVISAKGKPFEDEVICCGHTTVKALRKMGNKEVAVVVREFESEADFVDYMIRDNRTNEFAEWDYPMLSDIGVSHGVDLAGMEFEIDYGSDDEELPDQETDSVPDVDMEGEIVNECDYVIIYFEEDNKAKAFREKIGIGENSRSINWDVLAESYGIE